MISLQWNLVQNSLGDLYFERKHYESTETEYKTAANLSPTNAKSQKNLGHVYMAQKLFEEAEEAFKKSIHLDPSGAASLIDFKIRRPKE